MSNIESPKLDVRHLRMLVAVSELGSLTAAAAALHLTQSALSHQLREAEERVEAALFLRRNGRMVPTPAASALIKTAKTLLAELTQAESHAAPRHSAEAGILRVSTDCIACYQSWSEYSLEFRERCPQVEVQVNMEAAGRPLDALMNGEIDLAVINQLAPGNKQFSSRLVIRDEMMAVFARNHPLARKQYLEIQDFAGQEVLVYTPQSDSFLLCALLAPQKIRAKRVFEMPLTEDLVRMASVSSAVALLPRWAFLPYRERYVVETRRVTESGTHREWNAVVLKRSKSPAYFSKFIELMASRLNAIIGDAGTTAPTHKIARVNGRTAAASVTC